LATQSAYSPIETIVLFSVIGTLAYFHILSAIKHSSFLAPPVPSTLRPNHALLRDNEWVNIRENTWYDAMQKSADSIELQQFVFSLPPPGRTSKEVRSFRPLHHLPCSNFYFSF
jgi:hydroxymethylglutaryl-CoA reductase (NADPH)